MDTRPSHDDVLVGHVSSVALETRQLMHTIKGQVAVITGAGGGVGQALALDMTHRGATSLALVDFSDRVVQVAREINSEACRQAAIAYRGGTPDSLPAGSLRCLIS